VIDLPAGTILGSDIVREFAETAQSLYASEDLDDTLGRITAAACHLVKGCAAASVTVIGRDGIKTRAATDELALRADDIQFMLGEGPSLDAANTTRLVYSPDTLSDQRWPRFASRVAVDLGICSILSCRLSVLTDRERVLGALNIYGTLPGAFSEQDQGVALLLGVHAGAVVAAALSHLQLQEAIGSRDVIGQAKGILMERFKITADDAFSRLRLASQRMNVKLKDLARDLTETGELL
jgi:GAF domain-containing protein